MQTAIEKPTNGKGHPPTAVIAQYIALDIIDESRTNPRKTFLRLEELAADIKLHGVLEPVLVRPHHTKKGRFELVFGARRFRSSKLAGIKEIPAMVRELDDAKVLELQIVENSQRDDIHPLEEADGYQALHEKHGFSVEEIAAKVGKSVHTIRARLKFCALVPDARKAFLDGKLTAGTALIIARVPHEDLQKKALKEVLGRARGDEPTSAADASWIVRSRFMLRLVDAPFDRADAKLVAAAGACSACPKRTGNQRELFGDIEAKEDLCTDPKCFDAKKAAAWEKRTTEAKAKGQKVLSEKETKKIFPYEHTTSISHTAEYVDLDAKNYDEGGNAKTNRSLLGKAEVPVVIARDPMGGIHELVSREDFKTATKAAGTAKRVRESTPDASSARYKAEEKKRRAREAKKRELFEQQLAGVLQAAEKKQPKDAFWRALARAFLRCIWADARKDICVRRGLEIPKGKGADEVLLAAAAKMTGGQARGLCVEIASSSARGDASESFKEIAGVLGKRVK